MKALGFVIVFFVISPGISIADDPGDPDSLVIGNLDGSPIVVGLDEMIAVPLWLKTDDSVAFVHFPLATQNLYINERLDGEHIIGDCVPNMPPGYPYPDDFAFVAPDSMNADWTNQSLVAWWSIYVGINTQYEWCHKFDFYMRTTSDPAVIGDTVYCFDEGYNPYNGYLLMGLTDGLTEFVPEVDYGSIHFAISGVNGDGLSSYRFELSGAFPNPFNAQTTIRFVIPESEVVNLTIYDLLGRQIETLLDEYRQAGVHTVTFDASGLSSGVYFYRFQAGEMAETRKMVLLK